MSDAVATAQQGLVEKYQPYPEYKDSGVEWLGDVPTDWRVIKLGFLATKIGSGKTPSGGATVYVDDGITFLRSQNVYDDGLRLDDVVHITPDVDIEMAHSRVKPMDILINITGASIGRTCIVPLGIGSANVNQHVCIIRLNKSEIIRFVSWAVKAQSTKAQIDNAQTGAAREGMNFEQIASLLLSLPPETECEQISDFLDYETARIDRLIAQQQRLIELLKEKRQAVISYTVIKGLNPNAVMKKSGIEWFGQVPEHWDASQLKYIVKLGTSITYGIVQAGPHIEDGIPYIKTSDMSGTKLPLDGYSKASPEIDASYSRSKVYSGDLVIAIRATVGKCHIVPDAINGANLTQGTAKISPSKKITSEFLHLLIMSSPVQLYFDANAKGATFREITLEMLRRTPIVIPPLSEQKLICEYINKTVSIYDRLISKCEFKISLLVERRAALISAAVTGKIDLRGWKPPAEEAAA